MSSIEQRFYPSTHWRKDAGWIGYPAENKSINKTFSVSPKRKRLNMADNAPVVIADRSAWSSRLWNDDICA
jgi:hypothetical protein